VETQADRGVFSQLFRVLTNFHECFKKLIEIWRTCFLFLLKNSETKKENNLFTLIIKMKILFAHAIITSVAHASPVFLLSNEL